MKIVLALLGATSAVRLTDNQGKLYEYVQVGESKVLENLDNFGGWEPHMHEFPGTVNEYGNYMDSYNREMPERFAEEDTNGHPVDKFTQNLIKNYAVEGIDGKKEKDPKPTGHFYLTKAAGRTVGAEILCTHFNKCGADAEQFLAEHYDDAWNYYDVNKAGQIDAIGSSQFFRHLTISLGWLDI
mmetsp:Transcript_16890/g.25983  ORF Transcript_16890/g.25983 Transcript_16890/m.25983 type:complete len:184 (+) Transcript_16890:26-577(+)|eukprot:CAMPEP_0170492948 /NCGR_PEP_ID=MMETSP0208-20121228/13109_1 /TAXON_ID=197538 /ORGANISM="Strombidium inclinatum, Strain S3" /LENGTH=183 /DNA_ID=CAMNT_0010768787 /DNA_START=6 /DNA_END=557 /DNA_ORIENTATION=+